MVGLVWLALTAWAADGDATDGAWDVNTAWGPTHEVALDLDEVTWASVSVHGDTVAFELLGDLWTVPITGGDAVRLTQGAAWDRDPRFSPDGAWIAYASDRSGNEQLWVMRADGTDARQVTHEDVARVTDPVWDPSGPYLIGRRRTVDTRSIGVTELWQYHLDGGSGVQLTSLDAHPHAGEPAPAGERYVYFSTRAGRFEYNHDPMGGLWRVERLDRRTGETLPVVYGAGSAVRPTLSPDGTQLAVVTRQELDTWLEVVDLATGQRRVVAKDLDHDQMEGFALHGVYPAMSWTAAHGLVLWSDGKLWKVDVQTGARTAIPFRAKGAWTLHDVARWPREIPDEIRAKVVRWPTWNAKGEVAFSALGKLWVRDAAGALREVSDADGTGYAPAWSPDGKQLAWTSWGDEAGGALHLTTGRRTETLPVGGQLLNPAWRADGQQLAVLRAVGGGTSPDLVDAPYFEIVLLTRERRGWRTDVVTSTSNRGSQRATRLFLHDGRVWFLDDVPTAPRQPPDTALVSVAPDGTDRREHMVFDGALEIVPSPDFSWVAYRQGHQLHVAPLPRWADGVALASGALPSVQLTDVVGDWLGWTPDSAEVTWAVGPELHRRPVAALLEEERLQAEAEDDGDDAAQDDAPEEALPEDEVVVGLELVRPRAKPDRTLALTHARVVSMNGDEVLDDVTVLIEGDRIAAVGADVAIPADAIRIEVTGKTVIPGLIDVHAHLHYTATDVLPEQEWRYLTALDYGVTTVHDPSAATDLVFTQAERVAVGLEKGPRVYSTGYVLYGALGNSNAETPTFDAAKAHVQRLEAVGAMSVKVYQQSQRERRQWYAKVCAEEQVLCVPEGGGDLWMNLGMIVDGYHAIEHAVPIAPVYADVRALWEASVTPTSAGTAYSPTLLVAYGGLSGEHYFYQTANPLRDERLLRHYPARELSALAWRRPLHAMQERWNFQQTATDASVMAREGDVLVTLGAHGQLQGLGVHWELWGLASEGAMTPHEALRAGTIGGATYLGLDHLLGTVEAGKLADLVVLDADPLADIHHSDDIAFVIKNGEVFE